MSLTSLLGTLIYTGVLFINALAILSEDRFLARIGWSSTQPASVNAAFQQPYGQPGFDAGQPDIGVKNRLINLIAAVRTLMRSESGLTWHSTMCADDGVLSSTSYSH
ncbi:Yos1-domain-containing protein [Athelia psychrophila]|uniref:Yos1-domain-containing protein n=1 Tax=Athelia psychrophila TaxID=1759441 RepID=A0A166FXZ1_9AGAM|nr:Yos1-domain-containing protein [Fibularhizoctonia sp. CBS 109695]